MAKYRAADEGMLTARTRWNRERGRSLLGGGAETLGDSRNRPIGLIPSGEDETRTWYKSKIYNYRTRRARSLCTTWA